MSDPRHAPLPLYRNSLAGTLLASREAVLARVRPVLRDLAVTEQQWRVLHVLADRGASDPTTLARATLLFPPSVARILRDLSERGFVERLPNDLDRRRVTIALTAAGTAAMASVAGTMQQAYDDSLRSFGDERFTDLMAELQAFVATFGQADEKASDAST